MISGALLRTLRAMSEMENKLEKKRPLKMKKDKNHPSKKQKTLVTKSKDFNENNSASESLPKKKKKKSKVTTGGEESTENNSVFAVTEKLLKKKKKKSNGTESKETSENNTIPMGTGKKLKKKKKNLNKSKVSESKESTEDNSVFSVTEKLLKKKKEKKEKKQQEGQSKKKAGLEKILEERLVEISQFFQDSSDIHDVKGKVKPNWFDGKIKKVVKTYLISVEKSEKEPTPQNLLIRTQNEKKLYRFFDKLSKHLGEELVVIKHWFSTTKKGISKSGLNSKEDAKESSLLKTALLNKKLKAILKEATVSPVIKSDESKTPVWFDDHFAELVKIRNKAKRLMKSQPTEENTLAYRLAFKKVKSERTKRKKSGFVASNGTQINQKQAKDKKPFTKKAKPTRQSGAPFVKSNGTYPSNSRFPKKFPVSNLKSQSFDSPNASRFKQFPVSNVKSSPSFGTSTFGSTTPNKSNKHTKFDD